jgi:hypothetical protein
VDLLIFNIVNQNAKIIELKAMARLTPRSLFVNSNISLEAIFGRNRQDSFKKKMYLEFF